MTVKISNRRNLLKLGFAFALYGLIPQVALTQSVDWPSRPVAVIGPYAAGGNSDIMARLASQWLSERLNQRFVVENRVGAGGALAATYVAQAAPDGYTLLFAASPQIGLVPYVQKVNYDPIKDFVPISAFGSGPFMLAINAAIPAKTVEEFVAYAKSRAINYGSAGIASVGHLSAALFVANNKLNATHVPFRGGGPAMIALLGGQIDMYFGNASEIIPNAETAASEFWVSPPTSHSSSSRRSPSSGTTRCRPGTASSRRRTRRNRSWTSLLSISLRQRATLPSRPVC
jgi:tripartite-type tricarboxylate transporter receptor subunit TctC